ncbi:MAG: NYN domain-containing protein [bacterium]|nr:NYN domain-containing protein [bacterium]
MSGATYVLVDGENIDATLGMSVLGRRPNPEERPRWDRILSYAAERNGGADARGLFFLNASSGQMPMGFVQALIAMGYRPIPLASEGDEKVVDVGIQRTLEAIAAREEGDVMLASHDGDFIPQVSTLLGKGRRVSLLCFREFLNAKLAEFTERGLEVHDLETDIKAFTVPLPRIRIIPLDEFDPQLYL